jgi:hypothetical protein
MKWKLKAEMPSKEGVIDHGDIEFHLFLGLLLYHTIPPLSIVLKSEVDWQYRTSTVFPMASFDHVNL